MDLFGLMVAKSPVCLDWLCCFLGKHMEEAVDLCGQEAAQDSLPHDRQESEQGSKQAPCINFKVLNSSGILHKLGPIGSFFHLQTQHCQLGTKHSEHKLAGNNYIQATTF